MVLLDLNKNVASKTPLKSGRSVVELWFADDDTLVCCMGPAEKGIRVDVYKSNIARSPLKTASSEKAEESFLHSPVIFGAIAVALAVVVIVVVFVVRRKMASCVATDSQSTPLESASDSHINLTRQQDSPRFRASSNSSRLQPLWMDRAFVPYVALRSFPMQVLSSLRHPDKTLTAIQYQRA